MFQESFIIATDGRGFYEISRSLDHAVAKSGIAVGLCHVFIRHTSASLIICENADPDVQRDLATYMEGLVSDGDSRFRHRAEGPDDMPAHIRSVLTQTTLTIPIRHGRCALGTWQGVYVWEHRYRGAQRELVVTVSQ
ncbi:MAG: secondary thiamine-phosphate synthase enzyme YjbQ [Pseudomonadota bacterium]